MTRRAARTIMKTTTRRATKMLSFIMVWSMVVVVVVFSEAKVA
jgi:hypothetical protein